MSIRRRAVAARGGRYDVVIAPTLVGLGRELAALGRIKRVIVVTEPVVGALWAQAVLTELRGVGLEVRSVQIHATEAAKTLTTWSSLIDALSNEAIDRHSVIVAVGGGVLGDIAGFAAATVVRGVRWVLVPTTLLAMVDSSVGGKTGVNHPTGKNRIGAFHAPSLVWSALEVLETLPARVRNAGFAEIVKAALVADVALFDMLEAGMPSGADLAAVIERAVHVKIEVVSEDEREHGRRTALNLGHTVGHAIERVAGYGSIEHGEAVAIGLVAELMLTTRAGWTDDPHLVERTRRLLAAFGLPVSWPSDLSQAAAIDAIRLDKKADGAMLSLPVVRRAGLIEIRAVSIPDYCEQLAPICAALSSQS